MAAILRVKANGEWIDIPAIVGKTPVKGVDYFTPTDIEEIKHTIEKEDYTKYGLPVVNLTGDITGMDKDNAVSLKYEYKGITGTCEVKWQGSTSLSFPKKNYTITFDNAFEAKAGWGSHNKYCLKANWIDASHIRNILCAQLWGQMVKSRNDKDTAGTISNRLASLPNGGAIDGFPVIVVINGSAQGLYTFNIPKEGWMLGMAGANEAILCAENSGFYNTVIGDGTDFDVEYGANKAAAIASINNLVSVCNSIKSADDLPAFEALVDVQSLIDYYIFTAITRHFDGYTRNYIMGTYDGTKWFMSAYDMDGTFGNNFYTNGNEWQCNYAWYNDFPTFANLCDYNKLMHIVRTYYLDEMKARWAALKGWTIGEGNFTAMITQLSRQFPSRAYALDWELWADIPGANYNTIEQILGYYRLRMPVLDWELSQLQ